MQVDLPRRRWFMSLNDKCGGCPPARQVTPLPHTQRLSPHATPRRPRSQQPFWLRLIARKTLRPDDCAAITFGVLPTHVGKRAWTALRSHSCFCPFHGEIQMLGCASVQMHAKYAHACLCIVANAHFCLLKLGVAPGRSFCNCGNRSHLIDPTITALRPSWS